MNRIPPVFVDGAIGIVVAAAVATIVMTIAAIGACLISAFAI